MSIRSQYRQSLKHPQAEELLDLYLFRPIAFLLTKLLVRTDITPNQITAMAMLAGVLAGYCFAAGNRQGMLLGAALYACSNVLDCCDGMVARLKGTGTEIGRIIDVFCDLVTGCAVYIGLGIGLSRFAWGQPVAPWILVVAGGLSFALQASLFDMHRNEFLIRLRNSFAAQQQELLELARSLTRMDSSPARLGRGIVIRVYLRYMRLQQRSIHRSQLRRCDDVGACHDAQVVRLWSVIGSTTHVTVLAAAMASGTPQLLFWYTILFGNCWCLAVWLYQRGLRQRGHMPSDVDHKPLRRALAKAIAHQRETAGLR